MKPGGKWMKLKTTQFNSVESPFRIAYMRARMLGLIPFEGRDTYFDGHGHMYGVIGKMITVFDEKEREIAVSALVTIMAECLMVPGYVLQDYITWEPIDDSTAAAVIHHQGIRIRGVFHFNEAGEFTLFTSDDRYYMSPDQGNVTTPFSAEIGDYFYQGGIKVPGSVKAVWHLDSGRYEYWKGKIKGIRYNISL